MRAGTQNEHVRSSPFTNCFWLDGLSANPFATTLSQEMRKVKTYIQHERNTIMFPNGCSPQERGVFHTEGLPISLPLDPPRAYRRTILEHSQLTNKIAGNYFCGLRNTHTYMCATRYVLISFPVFTRKYGGFRLVGGPKQT